MNTPTKITIVRIFMIPLFVVLFLVDFPYHRFIAAGVFILASLTDWLDGYLARKNNQVTDLGKFLDPIADKLLVICALVVLITDNRAFETYVAIMAMIIIARELIVSGFRIIASSKNVVLAADMLGKIKTTFQMLSVIVLIPYSDILAMNESVANIFYYVGFGFLIIATVFTILSGCNYLIKNREVLK